jgi:sugar O-acyltransferase (sialic acid O-acetyltransferase NeuD family)
LKKRLFIFGMGNFAEMAHYLFATDSMYQVAGFTVDGAYMDGAQFMGLPVIAYEELRKSADRESIELFVAVGVGKLNTLRAGKVSQARADGFQLASFLSSHARVAPDFVLHPNTMIMDQVNIHPKVTVGADTIIWSNSRIALKAKIGNHVWITSALVGDSGVVGDYTFVGINATVAPFVTVGSHNLIGAAAVILHDTKDYQVYKGPRSTPSRVSSLRCHSVIR